MSVLIKHVGFGCFGCDDNVSLSTFGILDMR